jgi:4-hydroxybenzoate polyprenyltransferase
VIGAARRETADDRASILAPGSFMQRLVDLLRLARPKHWVKNGFVVAPLLFARPEPFDVAVVGAAMAFAAFCLLASAIYCINDVFDAAADREHPTKRHRPVAAGRIAPPLAVGFGAILVVMASYVAYHINATFVLAIAAYAANNVVYNAILKQRSIADIISIALGFVIRLVAGSVAIDAPPSSWLLVCGFSFALFLGFGKRRSELALAATGTRYRPALKGYSSAKVDSLMSISASLTLMSYLLYTVAPETQRVHGTSNLVYTVPPFFYGVFRYIFKVQEAQGESPEELILSDWVMQATAAIWALSVLFVLRFL